MDKLFENCCIIVGDYVYIGYKLTPDTFFGWSLSQYTSINNYLVSIYYQGKIDDNSKDRTIVFLGTFVFSKDGNERYLFEIALLSTLLESDANKYDDLESIVDKFLALLIFKHYAKVELDIVKGKERKKSEVTKGKITNETMTNVKIMDSRWFTSIFRNEGFTVRGYFKMQHKKNKRGKWIRELIYINEHQRYGYHRHAKILDDPSAEPDVSVLNEKLQKLEEEGFEIENR